MDLSESNFLEEFNKQEMCASQNTPVYIKRSCCQKFYL